MNVKRPAIVTYDIYGQPSPCGDASMRHLRRHDPQAAMMYFVLSASARTHGRDCEYHIHSLVEDCIEYGFDESRGYRIVECLIAYHLLWPVDSERVVFAEFVNVHQEGMTNATK